MRNQITTFILLLACITAHAQFNSTDVTHYTIRLNEVNLTTKTIRAETELTCLVQPQGNDTIRLSLLKLSVDSVMSANGNPLVYSYNDTTLCIALPSGTSVGDSVNFTVFYHGAPQGDPAGWGGFRFSGNQAFNMGVGFGTNPHNLGRVWFPCNDNFTDRARYAFEVQTDSGYKAFCNGILISDSTLPGGRRLWNWSLNQSIPTYLASVAIGPYHTWRDTSQNIPVEIACLPADTNKVSGTFANLDSVVSFFESAYGPYRFDKIGYCLVPFSAGAMEHATSIHIGRPYINGQLTYESLWVHELAHMWWGDWVTCANEGEMWLNEGFASFNEGFISQQLYGNEAYRDWFRSNHRPVLQFAHITDNAYLPLTGIPHEHTYGPTVYNKGADIAHTLRNFMGDSLFFSGCQYYFNNLGDGHATSTEFRDALEQSSGINLDRFFDDWVFTPGFPHFSIDSVRLDLNVSNRYHVFTRQRSKGNQHTYSMPVELRVSNGISDSSFYIQVDSINQEHLVDLAFQPVWWAVDPFDRMADAAIDYQRSVSQAGPYDMPETNTSLNVLQIPNPTTVRIIHHFVAPDDVPPHLSGIRISDYHYWQIEGILSAGFHSTLRLIYNGSPNTTTGFLDNTLITGNEDSLVLLYRLSPEVDWQVVQACSIATGNKFDKIGSVYVDTLKRGEYALGYRDGTTGFLPYEDPAAPSLKAWPNPSNGEIRLAYTSADHRNAVVSVSDLLGKELASLSITPGVEITWNPKSPGTYLFTLYKDKRRISAQTVQRIR